MDAPLAYLEITSRGDPAAARSPSPASQSSAPIPPTRQSVTQASRWVADQLSAAGIAERPHQSTRRPSHRDRAIGWARRASRRSWSMATTTCSRPIRWRNGRARRSTPTVRDNRLYARGVSDDKGPMLIPIVVARRPSCAPRAGCRSISSFMIEGEEETRQRQSRAVRAGPCRPSWRPTSCSRPTARCGGTDEPSITVASRGIAALEFTVTRRRQGSALRAATAARVANPAQALARARRLAARRERARRRRRLLRSASGDAADRPRDHRRACRSTSARYLAEHRRAGEAGEAGWTLLERSGCAPRSRSTACGAAIRGRVRRR